MIYINPDTCIGLIDRKAETDTYIYPGEWIAKVISDDEEDEFYKKFTKTKDYNDLHKNIPRSRQASKNGKASKHRTKSK